MASDQAMVHLILGLLDQHSFKTLEHAVQQFKQHKEKFHESLCELKILKPSEGDHSNGFSHPSVQARCTPLKPPTGGDFVRVSTQVRCTPMKPPLNSTFVQKGIENHDMQLVKPPLNSIFLQEGIQNGCKAHTLRPRASQKLSASGAPQRITRSRAKQSTTGTAAVCNSSISTEFLVLEDDFVEVRAKATSKRGKHEQATFQGACPTEAAVSGCAEVCPNHSLEQLVPSSQDGIATTTAQNLPEICKRDLLTPLPVKSSKNPGKETRHSQDVVAVQEQPEICKRELTPLSIESFKHPGNETFSSGDPILGSGMEINCSQDEVASQKQSKICKRELTPLSLNNFKHPSEESISSGNPILGFNSTKQFHLLSPHFVQQSPLLNKGNSAIPCQNIVNEHVHELHKEGTNDSSFSKNHSSCKGATSFAMSPSAYAHSPTSMKQSSKQIIDAVQCKARQEEQTPINAKDGACMICPKKNDALTLQLSPIILKHSPPSTSHEFNGTDTRQSNSRKRKLSACGSPTCGILVDDDLNRRKRTSSSINSIEVEAFSFDIYDAISGKTGSKQVDITASLCKVDRTNLCVYDQARHSAFKGASNPELKDSANIKKLNEVDTELDSHASSVALEKPRGILSKAHYETEGSETHAWDYSLQCVLKNIPEGKPALLDSCPVTQKVQQGCEMIEPSSDNTRDKQIEECNNESKQGSLVLECTCADQLLISNLNSPAVCFPVMVQPEHEQMASSKSKCRLLTTPAQKESPMHELPEKTPTLSSRTPKNSTAPRNTAPVNDDLSSQEKATVEVKFSPTCENCKEGDVFISPKVILKNHATLSPGMGRSPALNNANHMESNFLLSASESMLQHSSVNGVVELACDDTMPNLKMNKESASVSTSPCGSMSLAGKEPDAAENVLVSPDVATHSWHTEGGNTSHDMEEKTLKTLFSRETKEGCSTQLSDTCELVDMQVDSECNFAFKESIRAPGHLTAATEAVPILEFEEEAWIEGTNSTRLGPTNCEYVRERSSFAIEDALPAQASDFEDPNMERPSKNINSTVHIQPPILSQNEEEMVARVSPTMPQMETESCYLGIKLVMPCSQDTEFQPSCTPEELHHYEKSVLKSASLTGPSLSNLKNELRVGSPVCIPDMEMLKRTAGKSDGGDDIRNSICSQMDCSESPSPSVRSKENKASKDNSEQLHRGNEASEEWKLTPKGDEDIVRFHQLLAQGTVNSSRRKRARSPAICSEESYKDIKKMKFSVIENDGQISVDKLLHAYLPQRASFDQNKSSPRAFPPAFSPIRRFQDTSFQETFGEDLPSSDGLDSLQRQVNGSDKLWKGYSRLSGLRRQYLGTPHIRSARAGLVDRTSAKSQKSEWHLDTHLEDDGKENHTPDPWLKECYSSTHLLSEKQPSVSTRKVLGDSNQSLGGPVESTHKRYNLAVETRSFLDFVHQKQLPLPYPNGKREVRVKALEAAELARKQEEKRENERKMRRVECNEAKSIEAEGFKDKTVPSCVPTMATKGIIDKVKRVAELKMKMDLDKAKKQEVEQRKKEEERKKKEAEFADKKRKREDADRKDREEKRKRVEEVQRLKKEQEERQRLELEEKEQKRKILEERERERRAQEEEAKKHRRLEKEREAERRRKQEQHLKASRLAEKQAERKRKEAMLQARGYEDDSIAQFALGNKLSILSTESFAVSSSTDWEVQSKAIIRTRSQTSEDIWGLHVPCQTNNNKLSTSSSFVGNGTSFSLKPMVNEPGFMFEASKGLKSQHATPSSLYTTPSNLNVGGCAPAHRIPFDNNIQSYEISPYKSSSDEEDEEQPKKPIPLWARKENLLPQIFWQQCMDPDDIFCTEKTCSLAEIFGTEGSRRCKDFTQRSASGDWLNDHITWKEELDYKKAMGYIEG